MQVVNPAGVYVEEGDSPPHRGKKFRGSSSLLRLAIAMVEYASCVERYSEGWNKFLILGSLRWNREAFRSRKTWLVRWSTTVANRTSCPAPGCRTTRYMRASGAAGTARPSCMCSRAGQEHCKASWDLGWENIYPEPRNQPSWGKQHEDGD